MTTLKNGLYKIKIGGFSTSSTQFYIDFCNSTFDRYFGIRFVYNEQGDRLLIYYYTSTSKTKLVCDISGYNKIQDWIDEEDKIIYIPNSVSISDEDIIIFNKLFEPYVPNVPIKTNTVSYRGVRVTIINGEITHNGEKYTTATLPTKDKQLTQDIVITTTITN